MTPEIKDISAKLAKTTLFAWLTGEELSLIGGLVQPGGYRKGDLIFAEGEDGHELYLIDTGRVIISKSIKGNLEQVLAHLGPGEYFGEMAMLKQIPRTASASAEEDCTIMLIHKDSILKMMEDQPKIAAKIMFNMLQTFNNRLMSANDQVRDAVLWGLEATGFQMET